MLVVIRFFVCVHMGLVAMVEVVVDFGSELLRFGCGSGG